MSHGKEKLNDGRMTEASESTICAHLNYSAGQPGQRNYSAIWAIQARFSFGNRYDALRLILRSGPLPAGVAVVCRLAVRP
jgi:hypothetical protein